MRVCCPTLGLRHHWRRVLLVAPLCVFFYSSYSPAQDVAEAARQERARKAEQEQKSPHVYTDEDLKRETILTPQDQAKAEARKKPKPPSSNGPENAETLPLNPMAPSESLGEIARRYRKEKEEQEAAETVKRKLAPFPYAAPEPALATPGTEVAPLERRALEAPVQRKPEISPLVRPHIPQNANGPHARISPFQPRPLVAAPAAPPVFAGPGNPRVPSVSPRTLPRAERPLTSTAPAIVPNGLRAIQVRQGDSWWKLAGQYLGSGARWPELRNLNPDVKEAAELLKEGSIIRVPEPESSQERNNSFAKSHIVVRPGDTLWALAREHLGHASSWGCLASANPQVSQFTRLAVGSVLQLPDGQTLQFCRQSASGPSKR